MAATALKEERQQRRQRRRRRWRWQRRRRHKTEKCESSASQRFPTRSTGRCTFSTDYHGSTDHGRLRLLLLLLRAAAAGCCETLRRFGDGDGVRSWRWRWRWRSGFAFSRLCTSRRIPNDYLATDAADALETRRAMPLQASANARQATHNEQTDDGRRKTDDRRR